VLGCLVVVADAETHEFFVLRGGHDAKSRISVLGIPFAEVHLGQLEVARDSKVESLLLELGSEGVERGRQICGKQACGAALVIAPPLVWTFLDLASVIDHGCPELVTAKSAKSCG
jgi:hypothetical protein